MGVFNINGVSISGNNIVIRNGKVIVDGVEVDGAASGNGEIKIVVVEGVINKLDSDRSVNCGDVNGDVNAGGSVNCGNVGGKVNAGGSVNCDRVGGNISAGGSVICW